MATGRSSADSDGVGRRLEQLVVPRVGRVRQTNNPFAPFVLLDPSAKVVEAVSAYLEDLQAAGRSATTLRSYAMVLLRWFRFLWATGVDWQRAGRTEGRDFCRWFALAAKPTMGRPARAGRNPVTGKSLGARYAPSTLAHAESVCRHFYEFHREVGNGPLLNPFPLARPRRGGRAGAHHNPAEPHRNERRGLYRPKVPARRPRAIPDKQFNEIFARLGSHRDRALVAFYISTGARASELLGVRESDVDVGGQRITVVRKGTRAIQQLPASSDAFVWLRLYHAQMRGLVPTGPTQPLWWTLRPPHKQLAYHGAYRMFARVNASLGANWSLHDLRHTAAYRMANDPELPLTDVQWILGHASLQTTQIYLTPLPEDVIAAVLAHHARQRPLGTPTFRPTVLSQHYRPESIEVLFGDQR